MAFRHSNSSNFLHFDGRTESYKLKGIGLYLWEPGLESWNGWPKDLLRWEPF
jgi:prepilin-type processing-associated H-X9-DG protein